MRYWQLVTAAALAVTLSAFSTATAQPPRGKKGPSVKELEAEVAALKEKLAAAEKRLKAARDGEKKDKGRFGRGGLGKMDAEQMKKLMERLQASGLGKVDPEKMKEMVERFQKLRKERGKKQEKKELKRPAKGRGERDQADRMRDIEKTLDKLSKELEELRRSLRRK